MYCLCCSLLSLFYILPLGELKSFDSLGVAALGFSGILLLLANPSSFSHLLQGGLESSRLFVHHHHEEPMNPFIYNMLGYFILSDSLADVLAMLWAILSPINPVFCLMKRLF